MRSFIDFASVCIWFLLHGSTCELPRLVTYSIRCHVMEVESFENEEVAKLLNDWFISIKVSSN